MKLAVAIASTILAVMIGSFTGSWLLALLSGVCCYVGGTLNDDFPTPRNP